MGRRFCAVNSRRSAAGIAQGEFTSPEHFDPNGSPQNVYILWGDDKQLDELSLAVTRREEASDEA